MMLPLVLLTILWAGTVVSYDPCNGCSGDSCGVRGLVDVVFIIDWSKSSITKQELQDFHKEIAGKLDIQGDVKVGMIYFRKNAHQLLSLETPVASSEEICDAIDALPARKRGDTFTHTGLDDARTMLEEHGRDGACKVVVVVTDGGSDLQEETVQSAGDLQGLGVRMCVVQHGTGSPEEAANRLLEIQALAGDDGQRIRNDADPDNILPLLEETLGCIAIMDINSCAGQDCDHALISGDIYRVEDSALTASGSWVSARPHGTENSRLNDCPPGRWSCAWAAAAVRTGDWIQVDLGKTFRITAIATQGREGEGGYIQWVTSYKAGFSLDGSSFTFTEDLTGNTDQASVVKNIVPNYQEARYVRVQVTGYHGHPSMRWDVYGCPVPIPILVPCYDHFECEEAEQLCVEMFCREPPACYTDTECPAGSLCNLQTMLCEADHRK